LKMNYEHFSRLNKLFSNMGYAIFPKILASE
jgi:hypothetical protein